MPLQLGPGLVEDCPLQEPFQGISLHHWGALSAVWTVGSLNSGSATKVTSALVIMISTL